MNIKARQTHSSDSKIQELRQALEKLNPDQLWRIYQLACALKAKRNGGAP